MKNKYRIGDIFVTIPSFTTGEDDRVVYTITALDRRRNSEYFYRIEYYRKDINSFYFIYEHEQVIDRWISMHFVEYYPVTH
jgi:hypothetical protein